MTARADVTAGVDQMVLDPASGEDVRCPVDDVTLCDAVERDCHPRPLEAQAARVRNLEVFGTDAPERGNRLVSGRSRTFTVSQRMFEQLNQR